MLRCWEYEPEDRIDIFEVVDFLRKAVEENKRLGEKWDIEEEKLSKGKQIKVRFSFLGTKNGWSD